MIGPDEYHEPVDDNAFTNVMARWNLRAAARIDGEDEEERAAWLSVADALVDGYDPMSGLYEQFAGFSRLEPLVIADIAPRRPIAAELLLGRERTEAAQVLKQADVLMLHHLVPDEVAPGSLLPNLDFYEPRTAHGSSLSPAVHASLLARAGRFREALRALRVAARIDLDDLTGSTASGVHLATMGGVWQALVFGFAGVRPRGDALVVDPRLPPEWGAIELRLRFRGSPLRLRIDRDGVELDTPESWTSSVATASGRWSSDEQGDRRTRHEHGRASRSSSRLSRWGRCSAPRSRLCTFRWTVTAFPVAPRPASTYPCASRRGLSSPRWSRPPRQRTSSRSSWERAARRFAGRRSGAPLWPLPRP